MKRIRVVFMYGSELSLVHISECDKTEHYILTLKGINLPERVEATGLLDLGN